MKIRKHSNLLTLSLLALAVAACVTINVYFPEAAVKDLSEQIEEQIRQQAAEEETEPAPADASHPRAGESAQPSLAYSVLSLLTGASPAFAQGERVADPEVTNPAIRKIVDSRAKRLPQLNQYKASGVLGENNKALVEIRNLDAVGDLRERAAVQRLVKEENADREQLFREIAAAKNVDLSQLPKIQETYAETLREVARKGDWIQLANDSWTQK